MARRFLSKPYRFG
ncbi:hypothetical protein D023_1358A, partial [Vibrio parahaemolyticus 3256]